jgi:predicted RNase H-like nuclease (RuvC/YqgF family)
MLFRQSRKKIKELEAKVAEQAAEILQLRRQQDRIAEIRRMDGRFDGRPLV